MSNILDAAVEVQQFFDAQGWRSCVIGGLAVARWGKPRATQHVDFSLFVNLGAEGQVADAILRRFEPRIADAREFAVAHRVLLVRAANGVPIDIVFAAFPFESELLDRRTPFELSRGTAIMTPAVEDLIILKAFAGRARDWVDVEGILVRQAGRIAWHEVESRLGALLDLEGSHAALDRLRQLRAAAGESSSG